MVNLQERIKIQEELILKLVGNKFLIYEENGYKFLSKDFKLQLEYMSLFLEKTKLDYIDIFNYFHDTLNSKIYFNGDKQNILAPFELVFQKILSDFIEIKSTDLDYDNENNTIAFERYSNVETIASFSIVIPVYENDNMGNAKVVDLELLTYDENLKQNFYNDSLFARIGKDYKKDNELELNNELEVQAEFLRNILLINKSHKEYKDLETMLNNPHCFNEINEILKTLNLSYLDIVDKFTFNITEENETHYIANCLQEMIVNNLSYEEIGTDFFAYVRNSTNKDINSFTMRIVDTAKICVIAYNDYNANSTDIKVTPDIIKNFLQYQKKQQEINDEDVDVDDNDEVEVGR